MLSIRKAIAAAALSALATLSVPALPLSATAQEIETVDPDDMIDGDLLASGEQTVSATADPVPGAASSEPAFEGAYEVSEASPRYADRPSLDLPPEDAAATSADATPPVQQQASRGTYGEDDLIGAAEGLFGRGAEGLARLIQDILSDQGEPNGYIVGREGGGAFVVGVRYGSGTLHHAIEGNMPVYWTGPSIGLDAGANAGNTFVLVYNLYDTEELYERFPAGEGQAYFIGGFNASYVRKGDVVLIPIRVGAGLRLGVNAGYMRFSRKQRWLPF